MSYSSHGECIAVGVKAHVLYSRMLKEEDFIALLHCDSVAEIADQLKTTEGYAPFLKTLPPLEVRRHDLESALKASMLLEANSFLLHFSGTRDIFFRKWITLYEADNLKNIFRSLMGHITDRERLRRRLYPIPGSHLSYESLLLARNFTEIGDALRGTAYFRVLAEPLKRLITGEEKTLFPLEMAVDDLVETALHKALHHLEKRHRNLLMPIFGARTDLLNLYTVYRAITFYDMSPEEILNRLALARYKVQLQELRELARAKSLDEMTEILSTISPKYASVFVGTLGQPAPQLVIERNINHYIYCQALKVYRIGSPDFHTAISCFLLLQYEIKDIIKIIENVRYGYDRRHVVPYLTRPFITGGDISWQ